MQGTKITFVRKAVVVALAVLPVAAFAQGTGNSFDTTQALAWIAAGVAAFSLIVPAWMGFSYLMKAGKKVSR